MSDRGDGRRVRLGIAGAAKPAKRLAEIIDAFCADDGLTRPSMQGMHPSLTSAESVARLVENFRAVLFPGYFGATRSLSKEALRFHVGASLDRLETRLS